jgi:hypothetical protein
MRRSAAVLLLFFAGVSGLFGAQLTSTQSQAALALIPFNWQQLHYEVVFLGPKKGFRAMTFAKKHLIEVYLRPQDDSRLIAYDIAHELGHAIDFTYNTSETRRKWMELRGIDPNTPWFGRDGKSDYETPAGDFAETFALLVCGPKYFQGRIAAPPPAAQVPELKAFFSQWVSNFI